MTYTTTYDKDSRILTFTNTTDLSLYAELANLRYWMTLYQEVIPGSGYTGIKIGGEVTSVDTPLSISFPSNADGVYRLKVGYTLVQDTYVEEVVTAGYTILGAILQEAYEDPVTGLFYDEIREPSTVVPPVTRMVLAGTFTRMSEITPEAHYHLEQTDATKKVATSYITFIKDKVDKTSRLRQYRQLMRQLHDAQVSYTRHNYIEADKIIKSIK